MRMTVHEWSCVCGCAFCVCVWAFMDVLVLVCVGVWMSGCVCLQSLTELLQTVLVFMPFLYLYVVCYLFVFVTGGLVGAFFVVSQGATTTRVISLFGWKRGCGRPRLKRRPRGGDGRGVGMAGGSTPLHIAALLGNEAILRLLLCSGTSQSFGGVFEYYHAGILACALYAR